MSFKETSENLFAEHLPRRREDSRKGENGRVLVVGGSRTYHGAPFHSAKGAQAAGVDLVYLALPSPIVSPIRSMSADLIVYPLPDYKFTSGCARRLLKWLPMVDAAVVGPGLEGVRVEVLSEFIRNLQLKKVKVVLDAGAIQRGLNLLPGSRVVFTPHAGEFMRLTGVELPNVIEDRVPLVAREAKKLGAVILEKGHGDVISDGETTYVNHTGRAAMTVGGTGDVLAGLTAGFLALGVGELQAAAMAAYANGVAGKSAWSEFGNRITASDLYERLRVFLGRFDREDKT